MGQFKRHLLDTAKKSYENMVTPNDLDEWPLTALIPPIVSLARDSELSEEFMVAVGPYLRLLVQREGLTEMQALFLALIINENICSTVSIDDIVRMLDCENAGIIPYLTIFDELEEKGFIEYERDSFSDEKSYRLSDDVMQSLKENRRFQGKSYAGLDLIGFLSFFYDITRKYGKATQAYDNMSYRLRRLVKDNASLPILKALDSLQLKDWDDEVLLLHFCRNLVMNKESEVAIFDCICLRENGPERDKFVYEMTHGTHPLMVDGLIDFSSEGGIKSTDTFCLTAKARKLLLADVKIEAKLDCDSADTISYKEIVEKKLFFDGEVQKQVDRLRDLLQEQNFCRISSELKARGYRSGFNCLFYGTAGTGKTETVMQLAKQTGRDVMLVNISEVRSKWVGDSEKNIKQVFDAYRRLVRINNPCPILLVNEADAIFCSRSEGIGSSVDKMENSIQNIILQEMENLEGIMIATTNLQGNMDKAFERRFLYKVEFTRPMAEARKAIWHAMLPQVDATLLDYFAERYDFSGGQIENIARKNTVDSILYGPTDEEAERLREYCEAENLVKKRLAKIGFAA